MKSFEERAKEYLKKLDNKMFNVKDQIQLLVEMQKETEEDIKTSILFNQ